jgi:dienelactone hydrolase
MSSIIEGYNYDIFISYRQKDNKYDGWVTEFVDNLKKELEATFKEEISVYFDINPHDGLLETHDVDESLKEKLKCLIFVPIISRTYCDPKSFAWGHEFKAFVEQATNDQFGLKIKLPGGNTASRALPVQIHDLDADDKKNVESVLGGFLRGIEFIYKEPGVNRPLRFNEENPHDNLNHTIYRNQINKVALNVKEIILGIRASISRQEKIKARDVMVTKPDNVGELKIEQLRQENREGRQKKLREKRLPWSGSKRILFPGIILITAFLTIGILLISRHYRIKWATGKAVTEIEQLVDRSDITSAYKLVQKARKYISDDPKFREISSFVEFDLTVLTDPPGADVYIKEYSDLIGRWKSLGKTPIIRVRMPGSQFWTESSLYRLRIEKPGYEDVIAVVSSNEDTLSRKLFRKGDITPDMVYVESLNGFFIDRYEVSNKQYKSFIDNGGYANKNYWKNDFVKDGTTISWTDAVALFVDKSGRPGPSTWEAGDYPDGQDDYPVSGICWYEAAAFAEYCGKSLPSSAHWSAASGWTPVLGSKIIPLSNFSNKGPEPAGQNKGINCFGAYDLAGNVREWCWNNTSLGHIIRGGAWNDASYLFSYLSQLPSFDRSLKNGFRCVRYIEKELIPDSTFGKIEYTEVTDYSKVTPADDRIFEVIKNQFLYDKTDLNVKKEQAESNSDDWIIEKITYNAAYGKERVISYLFLPTNSDPPFQTLIFFPGMGAINEKDLLKSTETRVLIDYILKSGRAVMCPVYKGTFDRIDEQEPVVIQGRQTQDWIIRWVKDFQRSVDYLETQPDIDIAKLGYYGLSLGGLMGGIIPAVEDRLKVNILIIGGLRGEEMVNFVTRVKIPTLMLNGKYDFTFPFENSVKPFYEFLGTPVNDKKLILYETDHYVPRNEMIKEVLAWLDKYLGPVK